MTNTQANKETSDNCPIEHHRVMPGVVSPHLRSTAFSLKPVIVIDTREQKPYRFKGAVTKALQAGDYSVEGMEGRIAVERKSKIDAYSSLGRGRRRLQREFERLAEYDYAAIVIEATLSDFLRPPGFSKMRPNAAINTLVSWSVKYGVHVFFADDRHLARALTYRILQQCQRHLGRGGET